jgi:hypothetical protein
LSRTRTQTSLARSTRIDSIHGSGVPSSACWSCQQLEHGLHEQLRRAEDRAKSLREVGADLDATARAQLEQAHRVEHDRVERHGARARIRGRGEPAHVRHRALDPREARERLVRELAHLGERVAERGFALRAPREVSSARRAISRDWRERTDGLFTSCATPAAAFDPSSFCSAASALPAVRSRSIATWLMRCRDRRRSGDRHLEVSMAIGADLGRPAPACRPRLECA